MPFINLSFTEAHQTLENVSLITRLLKERKINPKEGDLLELLYHYNNDQSSEQLSEIKTFCEQFFDNGEEAFDKISRFVKSENKRVAWVLFSRTFQSISYDDKNPLEDYNPRVSDVLIINSRYVLTDQ
ncbi:MAG: hypothetical protein ACW964_10330 [Candidatus Hodarchaeales archaeon]|jgi:hypothetical protein